MTNPLSAISLKNPWHLLATGFGSGLSPIIPGTMGTLASIHFIYCWFSYLSIYVILVVVSCIIGIKICQVTSDDMGVHTITALLCGMSLLAFGSPWAWCRCWVFLLMIGNGYLLALFCFVFDMVKPWPIG